MSLAGSITMAHDFYDKTDYFYDNDMNMDSYYYPDNRNVAVFVANGNTAPPNPHENPLADGASQVDIDTKITTLEEEQRMLFLEREEDQLAQEAEESVHHYRVGQAT